MTGVCALLKVLMLVLCFAVLTSDAANRGKRSADPPEYCLLKADDGPCRAMMKRFFFNIHTQQCEEFVYGGCSGNQNRFESLEECKEKCIRGEKKEIGRRRRHASRRVSRSRSRSRSRS